MADSHRQFMSQRRYLPGLGKIGQFLAAAGIFKRNPPTKVSVRQVIFTELFSA
jgi:hypothetical protein